MLPFAVANYNRYAVLIVLALSPLPATKAINVCEYKQCRPNCLCDDRFDDVCAMEYGNYGWAAPDTGSEYLYHHMRPDVRNDASDSIAPVFYLVSMHLMELFSTSYSRNLLESTRSNPPECAWAWATQLDLDLEWQRFGPWTRTNFPG